MKRKKFSLSTLARILFALVMILGIAVGNVFAKYLTEETSDDEARVAAWGIEINVTDSNLFGSRYVYDETSGNSIVKQEGDTRTSIAVANDSSSYLVIPGGTGSLSFTVSGTAEVASKLSFDTTGSSDILLDGTLTDASSNVINVKYSPLVWTLNDGTSNVASGSLNDCLTKISNSAQEFDPNEEIDIEYTLTWAWAFTNDDSKLVQDSSVISIDQADTLLSLLAYDKKNETNRASSFVSGYTYSSKNTTCLNANLVLKITVEQID